MTAPFDHPHTTAAEQPAALGVAAAARAIRNGDISSESYAHALLRRAHDHADLNAFISIDGPAVLEAARAADLARAAGADAPLLGVPIGIKDSYLTQGLRTTLGVSNLVDFVPDHDAGSVAAIKRAGGIVFGKNNLVEMSYGLTGDNAAHGRVHNPHRRGHVTGGSSSGSGAAVAARLVPASLGGDTIGSIRVPASLCGVVGFKPTTGRWPRDGVAPISHTLDTTGVLARSVEDCALIDAVVTRAPAAGDDVAHDLQGVRLAVAPRQFLDGVAPAVEARFRDTVRRLREAGAEIVEVDLGADFATLAQETTWNIFFRETRQAVVDFVARHGVPAGFDDIHRDLKPGLKATWARFVLPDGPGFLSAQDYETAVGRARADIARRYHGVFAARGAAALILPTTPCTAPSIEHENAFFIGDRAVDFRALASHTIPASAAGLPGISIPIGLSAEGLPIGLEIDGPLGADRALLHLARRIEAVAGALSSPI